ncbi:hypothetical protein Agub_g4518, partial [Astrephomene gubernaculifera]
MSSSSIAQAGGVAPRSIGEAAESQPSGANTTIHHQLCAQDSQKLHQHCQTQDEAPTSPLGLLERLPTDLLASHIWPRLARADKKRLRQTSRGMARYTASEVMTHLQVLVCRASLLSLTSSSTRLHHRFPSPTTLVLRLLPPHPPPHAPAAPSSSASAAFSSLAAALSPAAAATGGDACGGGPRGGGSGSQAASVGGGGGGTAGTQQEWNMLVMPAAAPPLPEGWYGSTAVMSYFLSELGVAASVTSLSLQGWQELSPRDLHHVAACYPRLTRLHLAGA